jgi:predicted transcriptional regulator
MKLSKSEEQLMQYIWKRKKAFMNELLEMYPEPKPANTTVATLLKRMKDKGYIDYEQMGRSRQYYPTVKKSDYFSSHLKGLIRKYFDDSPSTFASFFTRETDLTKEQLEELQNIVEQEIKRKEK